VVTASGPKLDRFPSPQPLSDQEKLLASYVADDPHHAVLIARAQAELEKRDHEEEMREMNANEGSNQIRQ
jgi:Zn-dependent M16 (insulinase) family peptidase